MWLLTTATGRARDRPDWCLPGQRLDEFEEVDELRAAEGVEVLLGLHGEMQLYAAPVLTVRRAPEVAGVDGSVDEFGGAVAAQGELVGNHDRARVVLRVGVHGQQQVMLDVGKAELAGACLALALKCASSVRAWTRRWRSSVGGG